MHALQCCHAHYKMCAVQSLLVLLRTLQCVLQDHSWYCCKHHNVYCTTTLGIAANITMCTLRSSLVLLRTSQCVLYNDPWCCCKHHNVYCNFTLGTGANITMCTIQ